MLNTTFFKINNYQYQIYILKKLEDFFKYYIFQNKQLSVLNIYIEKIGAFFQKGTKESTIKQLLQIQYLYILNYDHSSNCVQMLTPLLQQTPSLADLDKHCAVLVACIMKV
eukprot:TRINITY_DN28491_c0_g1_i1.p1 TRINITY_DN28491_c0_g1~~TRINITY_DN28491_c0_g1_i1.p1  ORF type:complete len:111 (-),score=1.75 TRINITY_DN28491_c0_g1_i1:10-342(-)